MSLRIFERNFLLQSGELIGVFRHVGAQDRDSLRIELISEEAVKTSEIEEEILKRESVQSSLRHQFGLGPEAVDIRPAERGISTMLAGLYEHLLIHSEMRPFPDGIACYSAAMPR